MQLWFTTNFGWTERYLPNADIVLMVVIVTDRLISPPSNLHQKFDAFPPGQQPITNNPNRNKASSKSKYPTPNDSLNERKSLLCARSI